MPKTKTLRKSSKKREKKLSEEKEKKEKTVKKVKTVKKTPVKKLEEKKPLMKRYWYAVGRRKEAAAQVRLFEGKGNILVNNQDFRKYFPILELQQIVLQPLEVVGQSQTSDLLIKVKGGGIRGQAEAIRLGIARALKLKNDQWRLPLKKAGLLTRDARVKERKKYGLKRARRAPQWQKR